LDEGGPAFGNGGSAATDGRPAFWKSDLAVEKGRLAFGDGGPAF
jgi:hypothetical protein